ncbi:MAG: hypothetical protein VX285_00245, partial [Actinomycetota bacterium]|nr:hypothetical protein [Actinomycetota bacterium]
MSALESSRLEASAYRRRLVAWGRTVPVEHWLSCVVALAACGVVFWRLGPVEVFTISTPTGGDMGAHVWGPAFL